MKLVGTADHEVLLSVQEESFEEFLVIQALRAEKSTRENIVDVEGARRASREDKESFLVCSKRGNFFDGGKVGEGLLLGKVEHRENGFVSRVG